MQSLITALSRVQSQIAVNPGLVKKLSRDEGAVNISIYPPGTQRDEDIVAVSALFVTPDEYPSSQVWLMSDNEAVGALLNSVADEFIHGATLELVLTRILMLLGHEPEGLEHLFSPNDGVSFMDDGMEIDEAQNYDDYETMDLTYESDGEFEEDRDFMISVGHNQGLWEKFEEKYEQAQRGLEGKAELSAQEKVAEGRQIFDTKSAYKLLSKELITIMREEICDLMVEAIENDVYRWRVELGGFQVDSPLYDDLATLCQIHGYSTVQLNVTFKRGLHPFYPPHVEVIRPRFCGPVAWAVSSHPMLRLANWDPWRDQKALLLDIRDFLQEHARVDLESIFNSLDKFPDAAYSPAEIQLSRLEGLLEVRPRCASMPEIKDLYDSRDVKVDTARLDALKLEGGKAHEDGSNRKENKKQSYWAAGTGYGHGYGRGKNAKVWDAKKALAAQKAHDIETEKLISELSVFLASELAAKSNDIKAESSAGISGMTYALIPTLNDSCLIPFLLKELSNISFTNMCERAEYYLSVTHLIRQLCHPLAARMLYTSSSDGVSVFECLSALERQAQCYTKVMTNAKNNQGGNTRASSSQSGSSNPSKNNAEREARLGTELADSIIVCTLELNDLMTADPGEKELAESQMEVDKQENATEQYVAAMQSQQMDFDEELSSRHHFQRDASNEPSFPKDRLVRLSREIAGLGSLLPLNPSSSIFVRIDEQKQTLWSAMIVGPEDTPYSGGCFVFDIYFPVNYPNVPPRVLLMTTGGGRVRFNPNLYKNGKVCLSLLGTWSGSAGETWDATASSIHQVLVSIQSLILVSEPYFNEPGYEETMHTNDGKSRSTHYNQDIREQTIHRAMIDNIRTPPRAFADVIRAHFKLRKSYILETCTKWMQEAEASNNTSHATRLRNLIKELRGLLHGLG